ncbi:MAG: LytR/AlgR family response regulator transcription factor [Saprospiraceae bacterium]
MSKKSLLKAIIVEDEENGRLLLQNLLLKYCPTIKIVGKASTVTEAIPIIVSENPDVVFLDIELPEGNGFTLFNYFPDSSFSTIFVTASGEYALKALKLSALDYLLKPLDPEELVNAVKKLEYKNEIENNQKISALVSNLSRGVTKVALPTLEGLSFVNFDTIIRCEADNNYTMVYMSDNEKLLISKTLSYFEDLLSDFSFLRVNRYCIVNLNCIARFQRGKKSYIHLTDGTELLLSEGKREEFMNYFTVSKA